jgi:hypothetical protein
MPARRGLALLATIALLTVLGRLVGDGANLWPETSSPAMSNRAVQHTNVASPDTTYGMHTGFWTPAIIAITAPMVLSTIQVFARPLSLFQLSFSPLRPPKAS